MCVSSQSLVVCVSWSNRLLFSVCVSSRLLVVCVSSRSLVVSSEGCSSGTMSPLPRVREGGAGRLKSEWSAAMSVSRSRELEVEPECVCVCVQEGEQDEQRGIRPSYQKLAPFNNSGFCFVHLLKFYQKHAIKGHDTHVHTVNKSSMQVT